MHINMRYILQSVPCMLALPQRSALLFKLHNEHNLGLHNTEDKPCAKFARRGDDATLLRRATALFGRLPPCLAAAAAVPHPLNWLQALLQQLLLLLIRRQAQAPASHTPS
jgi:hypothetical protein